MNSSRSVSVLVKPIAVLAVTFSSTIFVVLLLSNPKTQPLSQSREPGGSMARSFVLWLHGLGDSGPANEPIKSLFTSPEFRNTVWSFPSAPSTPVTCNNGAVMPSWFDLHEIPVTADSPNDESGVLKAVRNVHAMIDKEVAAGTHPDNIFVCGFSQGGALTLASVLLYPRALGGGAVFSGWVPFNSSTIEQISQDAKKQRERRLRPSPSPSPSPSSATSKQRSTLTLIFDPHPRLRLRNSRDRLRPSLTLVCDFETAEIDRLRNSRDRLRLRPRDSTLVFDFNPDIDFDPRPSTSTQTPILWSHGMADRTVIFEAGQAGPPFLERAGISCEFKAYPGLGHSINNEELRYLESWIKARLQRSS